MDWLSNFIYEIDKFFFALDELSRQELDIIAVAVIAVGALFGFIGYRFFQYLIGLGGFLAGSIVGLNIYYYLPWVNQQGEVAQLIVAAVVGAIGALVFYLLFFHFGVFVFGAVASMWLGMIFLPQYGPIGNYRLLIVLALGFTGGILAFLLKRYIIIFCTSALGAVFIMMGTGHFYDWPISVTRFSLTNTFSGSFIDTVYYHNDGMVIITITLVLFVAGLLIQVSTTGKDKEKREKN